MERTGVAIVAMSACIIIHHYFRRVLPLFVVFVVFLLHSLAVFMLFRDIIWRVLLVVAGCQSYLFLCCFGSKIFMTQRYVLFNPTIEDTPRNRPWTIHSHTYPRISYLMYDIYDRVQYILYVDSYALLACLTPPHRAWLWPFFLNLAKVIPNSAKVIPEDHVIENSNNVIYPWIIIIV